MDWKWLDWAAAAVLGGLVGTSELISRYKDDPAASIKAWSGILYITINSAASVAALGLIHAYGWFGASRWTQILMAFFRTSLFVVRAGDRDVGIGPSGFLQIFLTAADIHSHHAWRSCRMSRKRTSKQYTEKPSLSNSCVLIDVVPQWT
jgi:hypothetical protein